MKKINEIFYSIQGEGSFTGTPAVFVRFSGCNLNCSFCDTEHKDYTLMSDDDILNEINKYPANHVVLTGGEPALQITEQFITLLTQNFRYVQIETNGTKELPDGIDWVTCSPKDCGSVVLDRIDELKVVYVGQDMSIYDKYDVYIRYLQPCSGENTVEVIDYIKENPKWKLSMQTHKLLNIR